MLIYEWGMREDASKLLLVPYFLVVSDAALSDLSMVMVVCGCSQTSHVGKLSVRGLSGFLLVASLKRSMIR